MFGAAQMNRFASAVSAARFKLFPCQMTFRGMPLTGCSSSIKTGSRLQEAGFTFSHDGIARLPVSALMSVPRDGEVLVVFMPDAPACGQKVRISEVLVHPNNPEYRIGLTAL